MRIQKAVITAAARNQRTLPLQTLVDRDGSQKPILEIILDEALQAGVDEVCLIVCPGDEELYAKAAGPHAHRLRFVRQTSPAGYGNAIFCARDFTADEPFLHLVGDHIYVAPQARGSARALVEVAAAEDCAVSAVQPTRENLLHRFGAVAGPRLANKPGLYRIESVIEKPTPTEAEQSLVVSGLRAGYYLCFYGMHVLTPAVMELLAEELEKNPSASLSSALARLAKREQYLAFEQPGRRYDLGARYGLLTAQLALSLSGQDREEVLAQLLELVALREPAPVK